MPRSRTVVVRSCGVRGPPAQPRHAAGPTRSGSSAVRQVPSERPGCPHATSLQPSDAADKRAATHERAVTHELGDAARAAVVAATVFSSRLRRSATSGSSRRAGQAQIGSEKSARIRYAGIPSRPTNPSATAPTVSAAVRWRRSNRSRRRADRQTSQANTRLADNSTIDTETVSGRLTSQMSGPAPAPGSSPRSEPHIGAADNAIKQETHATTLSSAAPAGPAQLPGASEGSRTPTGWQHDDPKAMRRTPRSTAYPAIGSGCSAMRWIGLGGAVTPSDRHATQSALGAISQDRRTGLMCRLGTLETLPRAK